VQRSRSACHGGTSSRWKAGWRRSDRAVPCPSGRSRDPGW
jgi:hypothetical protein